MKLLLIVTAASLISAGAGAVVGYKVAEKRLTLHFEERILKETAGMRVFYSQAKQPFATPEEALVAMVSQEDLKGHTPSVVDMPEKIAYHKIVKSEYPTETPPGENTPMVDFTPPPVDAHTQSIFDKPEVIPQDEFMSGESGYIQGSLTYYVEDGALADERDERIESIDDTVGQDNMFKFGYMSSDPNTVHIRNRRLQMEWEVNQNPGSYSQVVLGNTDPPSGRSR